MIKTIALLSVLLITFYGSILLFALATKEYRNRFYLGLFFMCSFLLFIGHFLSFFEFWNLFQYFDPLFLAMLLSFYPFFYLYIHKTFGYKTERVKWILHFSPSGIVLIGMSIVIVTASWESYEAYMNNNLYNIPLEDNSSILLAFIYKGGRAFHLLQIIAYNYFIIRLLLQSEYRLNNLYSNLDKYQLHNFYTINISFLIFMSVPGFVVTLIGRTPLNTDVIMLLLVCLLFSTLYIVLVIVGLRQLPIKVENGPIQKLESQFEIPKHEAAQLEKQILKFFKKEKPWLKSNLNIWDVAKNVGSNRTYISQVINEHMGCNFNLFVNNYRVAEAKKLLCKNPKLTLSEISELSGFGSVNSCIRIFKSIENCTPAVYRKNHC